jgi:hypothetical protein
MGGGLYCLGSLSALWFIVISWFTFFPCIYVLLWFTVFQWDSLDVWFTPPQWGGSYVFWFTSYY